MYIMSLFDDLYVICSHFCRLFNTLPFPLRMVKDKRYNTIKKLIIANALGSFAEILDTLPKTTLARDLGMHHQTFSKLLSNPAKFTFEDAFNIAALIEVDQMAIVNLIAKQCIADGKGKRKR